MKIIETHSREIGYVLWGHCQNLLDDPSYMVFSPLISQSFSHLASSQQGGDISTTFLPLISQAFSHLASSQQGGDISTTFLPLISQSFSHLASSQQGGDISTTFLLGISMDCKIKRRCYHAYLQTNRKEIFTSF